MFKKLVMFSSIVLLASLIICVGAYAYNAYCSGRYVQSSNTYEISGAMNNYGLTNGMYVVHAMVAQAITRANSYTSVQFYRSATSKGSASNGATAHAYVHGYDANDQYRQKSDNMTLPPLNP